MRPNPGSTAASVCENAALTSQKKTWFILEPNMNDQGLGTEIQLSPKAMLQGGSNLITF